jgi:mannose-1-phosphate guanylyltransferase
VTTPGARPLQALVLVGGQGTRLRPLTYDIPKPMLPIAGRPIIVRILEWLGRYGVTRAVLSLGYRPEPFIAAFPSGRVGAVELAYAVEPEPLDTAGAIRFAAEQAGLLGERVVVVNGDVLTDLDLRELVSFHDVHGGSATIALTPVEDPSAYGVVSSTAEGRVLAFIEKPPAGMAPSNLINAGTYVLEPAALAEIPGERRVSIEREIFPRLVAQGQLFAMASPAYWIDTGTPERYRQAQFDVLCGSRPEVHLPEATETQPGVYLEAGARLLGEVRGRLLLGQGAVVAEGACVTDSLLGAGVQVARGASISDSVLLSGAAIGAGALVSCSIIGPDAVIGEGAVISGDTIIGAKTIVAPRARLDGARLTR